MGKVKLVYISPLHEDEYTKKKYGENDFWGPPIVPPEERPPCPNCGKRNVMSRGIQWHCRECGRYWTKNERI